MTFSILFLLVILCSSNTVLATGPPKKPRKGDEPPISKHHQSGNDDNSITTTSSSQFDPALISSMPPASRSFDQWLALTREALQLYSNAVNLPTTGTSQELAISLWHFYNPPASSTSDSVVISAGRSQLENIVYQSSVDAVSVTDAVSTPTGRMGTSTTFSTRTPAMSVIDSSSFTSAIRQEVFAAVASFFNPIGRSSSNLPDAFSLPVTSSSDRSTAVQQDIFRADQQDTLPTDQSFHSLPAIPSAVLEKIRRGEFVNFDLLLPNNVPSETRNTFTMSLYNSDISQGPKIVVHNGAQSQKNKVIDLHSWFLAWCLFFQAYIIFRGHLACQLAKYQIFIAQLASNYSFHSWYDYDQAFRLYMANNPHASWDKVNEDIYNVHVRGAPGRSRCYFCGARDHFSSACPKRSASFPSSSASSSFLPRTPRASSSS